jgi:hypothetical protein
VLSDKELIHIMSVLNTHYIKLISTKSANLLLKELDHDYQYIINYNIETRDLIIHKGVVLNGTGNLVPLHLYPLRIVLLAQRQEVQNNIKAFFRFYQQLTTFSSKPTTTER